MAIFNSYVSHYQRVSHVSSCQRAQPARCWRISGPSKKYRRPWRMWRWGSACRWPSATAHTAPEEAASDRGWRGFWWEIFLWTKTHRKMPQIVFLGCYWWYFPNIPYNLDIWVWINTYENTINIGEWTSILTQLFWCEQKGYYWFWHTAKYEKKRTVVNFGFLWS